MVFCSTELLKNQATEISGVYFHVPKADSPVLKLLLTDVWFCNSLNVGGLQFPWTTYSIRKLILSCYNLSPLLMLLRASKKPLTIYSFLL